MVLTEAGDARASLDAVRRATAAKEMLSSFMKTMTTIMINLAPWMMLLLLAPSSMMLELISLAAETKENAETAVPW